MNLGARFQEAYLLKEAASPKKNEYFSELLYFQKEKLLYKVILRFSVSQLTLFFLKIFIVSTII